MAYRDKISISILLLVTTGCVSGKSVGELPVADGTMGDTGNHQSSTDPSTSDDGSSAMCECASMDLCGDPCGGPTAQFDENGCARASCIDDDDCAADEQCLHLGDWGRCGASAWFCDIDPEAGECLCGSTADCSESAAHCIPDAIAPPAVERCIASAPGVAFTVEPALGDTTGSAACTVLAIDPLQLDCTGDFVGTHTITLATSAMPAIMVGQAVTLEHWAEAEVEWLDQWLRITSDEAPREAVVAVQADALLPPGAPMPFWPMGVEVAVGDIGCLENGCGEEGGSATGRSIRVGPEGSAIDIATSEGGLIPNRFGSEHVITVLEAREGACGLTLGDQDGWYAFTIVQTSV